MGEDVPPDGFCSHFDIPNARIRLDNGKTVWGHECWWGPCDEIRIRLPKSVWDWQVVDIDEQRYEVLDGVMKVEKEKRCGRKSIDLRLLRT